ncbi:GPP34 family phosphoprotein [Amycolatopsis sp. K13G38]|uniref:GPP34 family phosphoprotein n=1 Tax=Amycolatopsis acididurans TaxID=2724524 RepID=A0ABX1J1P6_9PSEU|nr:GPP34 family phosphoprotein [Amycolatopsis acididurans]NKQ52186.1 GPP34 family phosphoprotein [Amycolatopsis acididurans]
MKAPETLPAQMFLLAFDPQCGKLTARGELGYLLRAATLADLVLNGHLGDERGKPIAGGYPGQLDPVLMDVWELVSQSGPKSWRRWICKGRRQTYLAVRNQLAEAHVVKLERKRALGLIPYTRIALRETASARRIHERVGRAVRGSEPAYRVEPDVAALAALASAGQLRVALSGRDRRRYGDRIGKLGERIEPIARALHRAISSQRAAAAAGG